MRTEDIARAAMELRRATDLVTRIQPLTTNWPDLDATTAYQIQDLEAADRVANGVSVVGVKLGLTSEVKQRAMNVSAPLTGWLTSDMDLRSPGTPTPLASPRVEPEMVFVMGSRLGGPGVTTARALDAVAEVRAGIEVIDSRYHDFRFTLPDVIADNASAARYVIADSGVSVRDVELATERCRLILDGTVVDQAEGRAVLGHPARALAFAANHLAERHRAIEAGWLVFTGGLTNAFPIRRSSTVSAEFDTLGDVHLTNESIATLFQTS